MTSLCVTNDVNSNYVYTLTETPYILLSCSSATTGCVSMKLLG